MSICKSTRARNILEKKKMRTSKRGSQKIEYHDFFFIMITMMITTTTPTAPTMMIINREPSPGVGGGVVSVGVVAVALTTVTVTVSVAEYPAVSQTVTSKIWSFAFIA